MRQLQQPYNAQYRELLRTIDREFFENGPRRAQCQLQKILVQVENEYFSEPQHKAGRKKTIAHEMYDALKNYERYLELLRERQAMVIDDNSGDFATLVNCKE